MKTYLELCVAVRTRESSVNYKCKNRYGYMGAYQCGMPRLSDLGLAQISSLGRYEWKFPWSEEIFLNSPILQNALFDVHVQQLKLRILKQLSDHTRTPGALSGQIMVAHLVGFGGLKSLLNGSDSRDALGTQASEYLALFSGYDIP